jgi:hypothetical protein
MGDYTLFDNIHRDYLGAARYSESQFAYLNRSARLEANLIRALLEAWFSCYPQAEAADLRARFRSSNDLQHHSAFFELFIHELLLKLGLHPQIHPTLPLITTRHPDFLIESPNNKSFYMEVVVAVNMSEDEYAARARMDVVYDSINRLDSPNFFIGMDIQGAPQTPPPAGPIRSFLSKNLAGLNPDKMMTLLESGLDALPHWHYEYGGWKIDFYPIPKSPEARGKPGTRPIGLQFYGPQFMDSRTAIRDVLCTKAGRYGNLALPYVVAVNALDRSTDFTDIMEALFGKGKYLIDFSRSKSSEPEMTREPDGVWASKSGPRYTRLSAALVAIGLSPWNLPRANIRLYHNPWANLPYNSELTLLPQAVPLTGQMKLEDGKSLSSVFDLPYEWPEMESSPGESEDAEC